MKRLVFLGWFVALVLVVACQAEPLKLQQGASCAFSSECAGKLICVDQKCQSPNPPPSGACTAGQVVSCTTTCGSTGTVTCLSNNLFSACQPPAEICGNNIDDNCDNQVEEGCTGSCATGQTQQCVTSCNSVGVQTCTNGAWAACQGTAETCDGKDNDCDGQIDEQLVQSCTNCGQQGTQQCVNGAWSQCSVAATAPETCDGKDNDCDGLIDEGPNGQAMSNQCVTACNTVGSKTCVNGAWSLCAGSEEICDGQDNDCDGQIDELLTQGCVSCGVQGSAQCINGQWGACSAPSPTVEDCDGQDNDCDGMVDEDQNGGVLVKECVTTCGVGYQQCLLNPNTNQKEWAPCDKQPSPEVCDGVDNDCNGQTDENNGMGQSCQCIPGQTQPCGSNIGNCQKGVQQCISGVWTVCGGAIYQPPESELCDGLDNNCNGIVDDNPIDSGVIACGVSNPALNGVGECSIGLMLCENGQLACVGGLEQTPEVCDLKDNDCDGQTDEPPILGDQFETNDNCATAAWLPAAIENQGILTTTATLYPEGDVDWYVITAKELSDFCFFCGDDCEGPYTIKVTLKDIPGGSDFDLCVYAAEEDPCATISSTGTCDGTDADPNLGIFAGGNTPETFTSTWDGACGENDDKDFYIKIVSYSASVVDCSPYTIEVSVTAP